MKNLNKEERQTYDTAKKYNKIIKEETNSTGNIIVIIIYFINL